jgi:PAS domain S-box-containing protein
MVDFEVITSPIKGADGKVMGAMNVFRDITERKQVEKNLLKTTEQLTMLLESLPIAPYTCQLGASHEFVFVGRVIEELTGFSPAQFITDSSFWIDHIHPGDRETVLAQITDIFKTGKKSIIYRFQMADTTYRWFADIQHLVWLADGTASHIAGVWQDITEEQELRQESSQRLQQLIQADKLAALGQIVAGVAHEINNPNSFIAYNIPLLEDTWNIFKPIITEYAASHAGEKLNGIAIDELIEDMGEITQAMKTGSERISNIVSNLKEFTRTNETTQTRSIQVNAVLKKTLTIVGAQLRKAASTIKVQLADNLPEIHGNPYKLEQVVANLLINAANAIPDKEAGRLTVETRYCARLSSILIEIEDNGGGMTTEIMDHIFDPFFTTRRQDGGTGLGLSVTYGLVQEHKGKIAILSRPGLGTRFKVFLPADRRNLQWDLQPTVLCVDDEPAILNTLNSFFARSKNMRVETTSAPENVVNFLEGNPEIDLVMADVTMPNVNGWKLLTLIKERFPLLPVILFSGQPAALETPPGCCQPDGILAKPFDFKKITDMITDLGRQKL